MTTRNNRTNSALMVIDVQNGVVRRAFARDAVVARIAGLIEKARREKVPVIWVQHFSAELARGSDDAKIVPELVPGEGEAIVEKNYGDAFEATNLEEVLLRHGVGRLIVTGAQTDACVRSTIHGAFVRGYDVTLVGDAHTTEDRSAWGLPPPDQIIAFTNLYWNYQAAPGRTAKTLPAGEIDFAS